MSLSFETAPELQTGNPTGRAARARALSGRFAARLHTDLVTLESDWRELERTGICSAYQQFDWVRAIARNLVPAGAQTLFVELRDAYTGSLLMIWPFIRRRQAGPMVISWLSGGVCDYAAPLMAEGLILSPEEARDAWRAVRAALPPADLIRIDEVPASLHGVPNPIAALSGLYPSPHDTFGTPIDGDPDTILDRVCSPSVVKEMAMRRRRLAKRGTVSFEVAATPADVEVMFAVLLEQRRARFSKLGRFDLLAQSEPVAFYREAALAGLNGGGALLLGLRCGTEWVATCYGVVHGGAFHISMLSIGDESWRNCSPGMLVVTECMRWSRQQGLSYFDFTIGDHSYKTKIGGQRAAMMELAQPLTAVGQLLVWSQRGLDGGKTWLKSRPALFERLRRIRQQLRRKLAGMTAQERNAAAASLGEPL